MDDWDSVATFDGGASASGWGDVASFDEPAGDDWGSVADFAEAPAPQQEAQPTPPPADDWYQKMYQDVTAKEAEANAQGINTYDYNLGLASSMTPQGNPLTRTVGGVMRAAGDAVINPMLKAESALGWDAAGELLASRQAQGDIEDAKQTSWLERTVSGVLESIAQTGTLAATGGLPAVFAGFGTNSYNDAHRQAIKEGKTEEEAAKIARANAAIEVGVMGAFQLAGLGGLESQFLKGAKWAGVKKFVTQTAAELTEEELTTLGQQLASKGEVGDPQAYADTAVQTIATMGLVGAYQKSGANEKVRAFLDRPSRSTAAEVGVEQIATTQKQRQELAAKVSNALTAQQFREQLAAVATSPEEASAIEALVAARAEAAGESLDDYVGKRIKAVEKASLKDTLESRGQTLADLPANEAGKRPTDRRGEIEFIEDGRAIIRAFESQDITTLTHEVGHLFRRDMQGDLLKRAEGWAGVKDGKWDRAAEEKFARGFERYLRTGRAPTARLKPVFEQFKGWLLGVYKAIRGTPLDVNFNRDIRQVFDELLGGEPTTTQTAAQTTLPAETQPTEITSEEQTLQSEEAPQAEGQVDDRFRGLANQTAIPEARAANYEVDVEMGYPDRQSWKDAEDRVAQRLQAEPDAALSEALGKIDEAERTGGTVDLRTMDDAALFNRLKEQAALDISNPEQRALHRKLHIAFRTSRTEQARSLGYRDPVTAANPEARARKALTDAIADPTPEEYEALKGARTPEERAAIDEKMEERYQRVREELAAEGIDLDDLDSILADPKKTLYVLDKLRPDASKWDIAYEYWRNAILSGPLTQSTNIIGNTLFSAWNLGPERAVEAAINLFVRDPKSAQLGEFKYLLGGIMPGLKRGLRNATRAWQLETSSLADELGREGAFKIEGPRGAIKGKLGRLVRAMGYRPLLAADEFAKSLTATMEVGAHAYRAAKAQGLQGQELQEFIASQTDDFASPAWDAAFSKAEEMAFQGKHGLVAKNLSSGGNKLRRIRGIRWIVPFVDTPASIMEEGLKRTPIFGAMLDYAEARKKGNNIVDAGMTPTLARQFIAMSVFAMLWDAVGGDDPWITGAAGLSDKSSRDASYRAAPPMSIKLFGNWWSYARIEPFATSLAWTVDTIDGIKKGQPVSQLLFGTAQQLKNKSYLDGIGEVMDMIEGTASGDPAAVEEYIGKMAASVVPNFWRQGVRALDGEMSESRVWGKELELTQRIATRSLQQAGVPGVPKTQRYDLWGRPIRYNDSWGSTAADFAWNLLSPVKVKDLDSVTQADLALLRWNSKNPNDRLVWNEPNKYVEFQGKTHYLTDQQYEEYAKLSGELAIRAVSTMNINAANPTKRLIESIGKKVGRAREMARKRLLPKWKQEWGK